LEKRFVVETTRCVARSGGKKGSRTTSRIDNKTVERPRHNSPCLLDKALGQRSRRVVAALTGPQRGRHVEEVLRRNHLDACGALRKLPERSLRPGLARAAFE